MAHQLFFICLLLIQAFCALTTVVDKNPDCKNTEGKCTDKDPRPGLFRVCMYQNASSILYCNYSNFTRIPDPKKVESEIKRPCKNVTTLRIDDSCLTNLESHDLKKYPYMKTLRCGENLIKKIQARLFEGNTELEHIDFCTNHIQTIESGSFYGLRKLQTLTFDNNKIDAIDARMFRGLKSLKELSFHNNEIAVLNSRSFFGLHNLEVLTLTANKIAHIEKDAFAGLKSLTHLHLDGNRLYTLNKDTFSILPKLQVLTLSYNKFVALPDFAEDSLANVHTLNLAHNLLEEFKSSNIANLSKLQNLSLENNSLQALPEDLVLQAPYLRILNISKNNIAVIEKYAFSSLCHLETLDIHQNHLKTPHPEWFSRVIINGLPHGNDVSQNLWHCDCHVIKYEAFLRNLSPEWRKALGIKCESPKKFGDAPSLDHNVSERIKEGEECPDEKPYGNSTKACTVAAYPFERTTDIYTYKPTTQEESTIAPQALNEKETDTTPGFYSNAPAWSTDDELPDVVMLARSGLDTLALSIIGVAVLLLVVIIVVSAFCVHKRKKLVAKEDKNGNYSPEEGRVPRPVPSLTNRTELESGRYDKLQRDPVAAVQSAPPSLESENETLLQSQVPDSSLESQNASEPSYVSMHSVPTGNTVPKELLSVSGSREQNVRSSPPQPRIPRGPRRQPDGASVKRDNT